MTRASVREATVVAALVVAIAYGSRADAGCNLIPGTAKTFNGVLGATNRPFAAPGERVELRSRPCDHTDPLDGITGTAAQHVVTVAFQPPAPAPRHVVVLAPGSGCGALGAQLATCGATREWPR